MNPKTVESNYKNKLWTKAMVKVAVKKGVITKKQYKEITGEDYV